jgi:hypothetical protein
VTDESFVDLGELKQAVMQLMWVGALFQATLAGVKNR